MTEVMTGYQSKCPVMIRPESVNILWLYNDRFLQFMNHARGGSCEVSPVADPSSRRSQYSRNLSRMSRARRDPQGSVGTFDHLCRGPVWSRDQDPGRDTVASSLMSRPGPGPRWARVKECQSPVRACQVKRALTARQSGELRTVYFIKTAINFPSKLRVKPSLMSEASAAKPGTSSLRWRACCPAGMASTTSSMLRTLSSTSRIPSGENSTKATIIWRQRACPRVRYKSQTPGCGVIVMCPTDHTVTCTNTAPVSNRNLPKNSCQEKVMWLCEPGSSRIWLHSSPREQPSTICSPRSFAWSSSNLTCRAKAAWLR